MLVLQGMGYQYYRVCNVYITGYVMPVYVGFITGYGMSVVMFVLQGM